MNVKTGEHETLDEKHEGASEQNVYAVAGGELTLDERETFLLEALSEWEQRSKRSVLVLGEPVCI